MEFTIYNFKTIPAGLTVKKNGALNFAFQDYKQGFRRIIQNGTYLKILEDFYGRGKVPDSILLQ